LFFPPRRVHHNGALRNIGLKIGSVAFNGAPHAPRAMSTRSGHS
jgi:hypothetical protein